MERQQALFANIRCRAAVSAIAIASSMFALAKPAAAQTAAEDGNAEPEIIVTGTLIRGVASTGASVVSVSQENVQATGASTTAQLLQSIPQLGVFNGLQAPGGGNVTVNRPNLRFLPGFNTAGSSTTLVLMNGHRSVGMGISSTTPDPDFIPPGAISRLEIVPDGGSAIYGSDAVAGVMNFITRKDFDGVELNGHGGFADNYQTYDANATIGHKWNGGSIFVSYAYSQHDAVFGRDRDYVQTFPTTSGLTNGPATFTSVACAPGNVVIAGTIYALPFTSATAATAAGKANQCDLSDDATLYPSEHRHAVMAGLNQELSSWLSVETTAYYFNRQLQTVSGPFNKSASVTAATAGFAAHRVGTETSQTVQFAWGGPEAQNQRISLESWGTATTFTAKLGGDWQLRVLGNYGESTTESHQTLQQGNDNALNIALAAGLFNPYDPSASNPAAYATIANWETFGRTRQRLINFKAVADGTLFDLPGGPVKLAGGGEFIHEGYDTVQGNTIPGAAYSGFGAVVVNGTTLIPGQAGLPRFNVSRDVKAAFGELSVPIIGDGNALSFLREVTLSLSGRYDDYSDVGDTFNPKIGLTIKPVDWIRLRGSWGKSFNAPSLADAANAAPTTGTYLGPLGFLPSILAFTKPPAALVASGQYPAPGNFQTVLLLGGNSPGIEPQKAKTLSLGADIEPPFVPGLRFGATYWRIKLDKRIGLSPFFDRNLFWNSYGNLITVNPTDAQIAAALANANTVTGARCAGLPTGCVYAILDGRKTNLGDLKVSGIDFYANFQHETGFGSIDISVNGTKELKRGLSQAHGGPLIDQDLLLAFNTFRLSSTLGANTGNLRAQVTWNHLGGFDILPVGLTQQAHVSAFNVFNLFFKYDVNGEGVFEDLAFTLNVDNVFDQDPPSDRSSKATPSQAGYGNGATLGRLVQFGISKKF